MYVLTLYLNAILGTTRQIGHVMDSQRIGSSCHKVEQGVRQKIGETNKLSQMHS